MGPIEILTAAAAVVTVVGGLVKLLRRKKRSGRSLVTDSGVPLWDAVIRSEMNGGMHVVARMTVAGLDSTEAGHRAGNLLRNWNDIRLGFAWPLDQDLPVDDDGQQLVIVDEEYLPHENGKEIPVTVSLEKRQGTVKRALNTIGGVFSKRTKQ